MKYLLEGIGWRQVQLMMADQISYKPGPPANNDKGTSGNKKKNTTTVTSKADLLKKINQSKNNWEQ